MDEEKECEEYMRMVKANERNGTASYEDKLVASHCVQQNKDLECSATSDLDDMNTAHSAFNILNQIVIHLKHQSREHEAYTNGLKKTLQWRYSGDEDNRSGQVDIDLVGYSQRLQLNSVDEAITVMVPLVMTCPVFLSDFASFRHVMALTGFIQDDVQPLAEGKFGAFFRMYTSDFASMKRPDVLHLSDALDRGFFSRSGLGLRSRPPPRE
ncbi:uncharacterized protein CCOS01_16623 [Colletotrichum costaricense]|uniref:Uncharacterized protein n=2 Tax=Colletotrichum acutatum species complex TaxID=2707335 RepID=A0AAI9YF34_9PEZI|nr:uncharacterized protein CCOS01_16623 [Colletotrichum costaricense]XP_060383556.1 uncharacterized protein CTAM01_05857 [Colletotrichum tamarilloi]KAK1501633.1 hypothetical protein CTAM01_05857 [Colletotrichum tamarilloi]KAK1505933.1 hypothetical protein CCOS01_16623 [Colletotrichum costaricense]